MHRHAVSRVVLFLSLALLVVPLISQAQPQKPARVALSEFRSLRWLIGAWRGSGGSYPSFYEDYRVIDDSTIRMRSFADSTFRVVSDSSRIELRSGTVYSRDGRASSVAIELSPTRIHFVRDKSSSGGYTFSRQSADQWTATLHPSAPGGAETVYVMRRLRP